jgi:signal peptidase II
VQGGGRAEEGQVVGKLQKSLLLYLGISFLVVVADQISKLLIQNHLAIGQSVSVIGDILNFHFIYNQGGAMGTSIGPSWVYTILTLFALYFIIRYFSSSNSDGALARFSLALILGGAIGNLIDRLRMGKVVDFIDFGIPGINFRWFTFNIADAAITIGLILFAISILFHKKPSEDGAGDHLPESEPREIESDSAKT